MINIHEMVRRPEREKPPIIPINETAIRTIVRDKIAKALINPGIHDLFAIEGAEELAELVDTNGRKRMANPEELQRIAFKVMKEFGGLVEESERPSHADAHLDLNRVREVHLFDSSNNTFITFQRTREYIGDTGKNYFVGWSIINHQRGIRPGPVSPAQLSPIVRRRR